jgi:hypothetical protein
VTEEIVPAMDALLDRLVAVLAGSGLPSAEPTTGTAADGAIVAELGADARLASLRIDPRLLRRPEEIGPGIVAAVNEATRARPERAASSGSSTELAAIKQDSLELTKRINASLTTAIEQLKPSSS